MNVYCTGNGRLRGEVLGVMLGPLAPSVTEVTLHELVVSTSSVTPIQVVIFRNPGKLSKDRDSPLYTANLGFVECGSADEATKVFDSLNETECNGFTVQCGFSRLTDSLNVCV